MAAQLTKEQRDEIKQFLLNDKDGSGTVTAQEIIDFTYSMGANLTEEQMQVYCDWVESVDSGEDGAVSVEEFLAAMERNELVDTPLDFFKTFDKDGSGFITKDEIRQGMKEMGEKLTDEGVEDIMKDCDTDGDGKINYEEFVKGFANQEEEEEEEDEE
ncbi:uncharacterized protein [Branchiostoma lanceolatum]|uniref:uncharacterized protein n=1 Tax=Branchiostoma lanceolatum TaxID=7740 RepID=UPI0034565CE8